VTPRLVFRPEAETELLDARTWYEAERVGLGAVFAAAVETTIAEVLQNPLAYPRVRGHPTSARPSLSVRRVLPPYR
jgi:plasmid stabilization system protein ParE